MSISLMARLSTYIQMAMGECLAYSSTLADFNDKFAIWPMIGGYLALTHIHSGDPGELSQWRCHRR